MAIPAISQSPFDLQLEWYAGDPVSLSWKVLGVNWSGTYTGGVYKDVACTQLLATATITATYSSPDTTFVFSLSDAASDAVPAGLWYWKVREQAGLTKFAGSAEVDG